MMNPPSVRSYAADEGGPLALAKSFLISRNLFLESLTWENTDTSTAYIQIFNVPRLPTAVAITDTNMTTGILTAVSHGYTTGDKVTLSGIATITTAYLRDVDGDRFTLYSTRAGALAGGINDVLPDTDGDTGTFLLASLAATTPVYEEYPVLGSGSAPSNIGSYTNAQFSCGLYVRAVTASGGSTLISGSTMRFTPRYLTGPLSGTPAYED